MFGGGAHTDTYVDSSRVVQFQNIDICGGGFSTGLAMAPDGTMFGRNDTYGGYVNSTVVGSRWQQVVTQNSMPSDYTSTPTPYLGGGIWEIAIDPSNPSILWMIYTAQSGRSLTALLKSVNKGLSWTRLTNFPLTNADANGGNARWATGQKIAVDPHNPNVVWVSTLTDLYVTQDGGATWDKVSPGQIPSATGGVGFCAMQFDPISGTTAITGGVGTNRLIVGNTGNGVYVSSNAYLGKNATWTLVSGTAAINAGHGKIGSDGNYYFNNQSQGTSLYRIDTSNTLTTQTNANGAGVYNFAIDPNNPSRAVALGTGQLSIGGLVNGGSPSWGTKNTSFSISATDAPWQQYSNGVNVDGECWFDPFKTTSAASQTIDNTNAKTFNDLPDGLNLVAGDLIRITNTGTPGNYMLRTVASYVGNTLVTSATGPAPGGYLGAATGGSGTFGSWTITKERLWIATGFGIYWTDNINATANVVWNSQNGGIEDMVAHHVIWPPGNVPVLANSDKPIFQVTNNPFTATIGLSDVGPARTPNQLNAAAIDWASNVPTEIVASGVQPSNGATNLPGINLSSGVPGSWTTFASLPPNTLGSQTSIAAADANLMIAADKNAIDYTTDGGATWTAVPGLTSGFVWSGSWFDTPSVCLAADRVNIGTFYAYNMTAKNLQKIVLTTAPSVTVTAGATSVDPSSTSFKAILKTVPGKAGHMFWTAGTQSGVAGLFTSFATVLAFVPSTSTYPFKFSSDAGASLTALANVSGVLAFGFGAAAAGQSYPSIYIAGWVSGIYGLWRCDNFNPASLGGETWTKIGTFARGWLDIPVTIEGSPNQWGRGIIGHAGSSYAGFQVPGQTNGWP